MLDLVLYITSAACKVKTKTFIHEGKGSKDDFKRTSFTQQWWTKITKQLHFCGENSVEIQLERRLFAVLNNESQVYLPTDLWYSV